MGFAVSAYLSTLHAMDPQHDPDHNDFAERFVGELQARLLLAGWRKGQRIEIESTWNLPLLASFADPAFSASELNDLPPPENAPHNAEIGGVRHG